MKEHIAEKQVTIKVLRVGTKQFTQSMLKQLPHKDYIARIKPGVWGYYEALAHANVWGYVVVNSRFRNDNTYFVWELADKLYVQQASTCCNHGDDVDELVQQLNISQLFIGV